MQLPTAESLIGQTLNGRYQVVEKIGEGGFGSVYKAVQVQMGREVALKVLNPGMSSDPQLVARFKREAQSACNLHDPHTIITYDFDHTEDGTLYLAMELLKGKSLQHEMQAGPMSAERTLRIVEQICTSLGEAHSLGIVHRDIKPENIYLEARAGQKDFVKVLDFGIAKIVTGDGGERQGPQLTATGQTLGTLEYMSPEQLMGKPLDGRSDLYAVAVVMYEMLTGKLPFDTSSPGALITAQLRETPKPPSQNGAPLGTPGVDAIILRTLEKDRDRRWKDAGEMREAILAELQGLGVTRANTPLSGVPAYGAQGPGGGPYLTPPGMPAYGMGPGGPGLAGAAAGPVPPLPGVGVAPGYGMTPQPWMQAQPVARQAPSRKVFLLVVGAILLVAIGVVLVVTLGLHGHSGARGTAAHEPWVASTPSAAASRTRPG